MNKYRKHIIFTLSLVVSLSFIRSFNRYEWLLFASFSEYINWYPKFGIALWLIKLLYITIVIIAAFILLIGLIKILNLIPTYYKATFSIFIGYICLAIVLNGNHPFTTFKMYSSLSTWAYNFELQDKEGRMIPYSQVSNYTANNVTKIYEAYFREHNLLYGNNVETKEQLKEVGVYLLPILIDSAKVKEKQIAYISLYRVMYTTEDDSLITNKVKMSELRYE